MVKLHAQYLIDARGRRHAVQLPVREFRRLIEVLEDLEDIAYIKAHRHEPLIPMAKVHTSSASRQFRHVPREVTLSLQHAITSLAQNPRAMHTEKLAKAIPMPIAFALGVIASCTRLKTTPVAW